MTKAEILNEIKRTAKANGGVPLGSRAFATETGIGERDWKGKLWARWSDALQEAGFAPNKMVQAYSGDELLGRYAKLAIGLGRLPTAADVRFAKKNQGLSFPEWTTMTRQFGGMPQLVERLRRYCESRNEYAAIVQICDCYVPRRRGNPSIEAGSSIGFVYLIKSGRFHKIGRSNSSGRRHYELSVQLPDKATLVHEIRTDDPVGIEAYWHKRFEASRKNGEWFDLASADVAAFKRRKFM